MQEMYGDSRSEMHGEGADQVLDENYDDVDVANKMHPNLFAHWNHNEM